MMIADYNIETFGPGILYLFNCFYSAVESNYQLAVVLICKIEYPGMKHHSLPYTCREYNIQHLNTVPSGMNTSSATAVVPSTS